LFERNKQKNQEIAQTALLVRMMEITGGYSELISIPLPFFNALKEYVEYEWEQKNKQSKGKK